MSKSETDIAQAKKIGAQGGKIDTHEMLDADRQRIEKAVNDGRSGK